MESRKQILLNIVDEIQRMRTYSFFHVERTGDTPERDDSGTMSIQPWPRFSVVLSGSINLEIRNRKLTLGKGSVPVLSPYCYCRSLSGSPHRSFSVVLRDEYLRLVYNECEAGRPVWPPTLQYHIENSLSLATTHVFDAFFNLRDIGAKKETVQALFAVMMDLIRHDLERGNEVHHDKSYYSFLAAANFVEQNYDRPISRSTVGKKLHLSISYLSRLFRQYAGTTVYEYQMQIRMRRAVTLLKDNDLNIGEIAWQCGFRTTSFFIRKFKEHYAATPAQYRLRARFRNSDS